MGLRLGADEYVTKPFYERLLIERIRTLLRRHDLIAGKIEPDKSDTNVMKRGDLILDMAYGDQVYIDDRTIDSHVKRLRKKCAWQIKDLWQLKRFMALGIAIMTRGRI